MFISTVVTRCVPLLFILLVSRSHGSIQCGGYYLEDLSVPLAFGLHSDSNATKTPYYFSLDYLNQTNSISGVNHTTYSSLTAYPWSLSASDPCQGFNLSYPSPSIRISFLPSESQDLCSVGIKDIVCWDITFVADFDAPAGASVSFDLSFNIYGGPGTAHYTLSRDTIKYRESTFQSSTSAVVSLPYSSRSSRESAGAVSKGFNQKEPKLLKRSLASDVAPSPLVEPAPSVEPAVVPAVQPAVEPSVEPTPEVIPSVQPAIEPSVEPSVAPSVQPSVEPSVEPSVAPSVEPSVQPAVEPSVEPAVGPSIEPSVQPSVQPSVEPSVQPSVNPAPSPAFPLKATASYTTSDYNKDGGVHFVVHYNLPTFALTKTTSLSLSHHFSLRFTPIHIISTAIYIGLGASAGAVLILSILGMILLARQRRGGYSEV